MSRAKRRRGENRAGLSFEKAIAQIQTELDPSSTVTHNEIIMDRNGNARQCDVTIRGKVGEHEVLGVMECRDLTRKVGVEMVDAFNTKTQDLLANIRVMVSRFGFTKDAQRAAKNHDIRLLSLLKPDAETRGVMVGTDAYASVHHWTLVTGEAKYADGTTVALGPHYGDALLAGAPLRDWLVREVYTVHLTVRERGWHVLEAILREPTPLTLAGQLHSVVALTLRVYRLVELKKQTTFTMGRGLIDHRNKTVKIPAGGKISTVLKLGGASLAGWEPVPDGEERKPSPFPPILLFWQPRPLPTWPFTTAERFSGVTLTHLNEP